MRASGVRTRLHHGLSLLRRARCDVGQGPGRLKLQRRATEQRGGQRQMINMRKIYVKQTKKHSDGSYLSSLSRQCTRMGRIPDLIRSSMGGLRSLDSSFLQEEVNNSQQDASHSSKSHTTVIEETLTKHWTVITKHHDEYEPLLTWRPERR